MMPRSKIRIWLAALLILLMSFVTQVNAPAEPLKLVIVKCSSEDLDRILAEIGGAVVDANHGHFVLAVSSDTDTSKIEAVSGTGPIQASENSAVSINRKLLVKSSTDTSTSRSQASLGAIIDWYGTPARQGYVDQAAATKIRLQDALAIATGGGAGIRVAVIDTGIDEEHPTLKPVVMPGKNYIGRTSVPSEWDDPTVSQSAFSFVDQSAFSFVDQSAFSFVDQSAFSFVDQSAFSFVDQSAFSFVDGLNLPPAFGHGTMMAGLVHLVAPRASIIPLKAFDATGAGTEWNIVQAIYDAIDLGADVISMSFSSRKQSKIMESAVRFAAESGVLLVAADGNDNSDNPTYPASFKDTIAVSALDYNDQKAVFSNFGPWVGLSAIGINLVTTYPGGHWAMGSGTSDSVPLVSGVLALVKERGAYGSSPRQKVEHNVDPFDDLPGRYRNKLGKGRLDAFKAVRGGYTQ